MDMNCNEVADKLSEFMDGELESILCERLLMHIDSCASCKKALEFYHRMGTHMRNVEQPVDTELIWSRIELAIPGNARTNDWWLAKWFTPSLVLAASLMFVIAGVSWLPTRETGQSPHQHANHKHDALAVDFQSVIDLAQSEPQKAIASLMDKYDGKMLDEVGATKYVGYRPALFSRLPDGFQRVSTHVLNMPCCKCTVTVCNRQNGTSLIVFEHKDEQPVWFGDLPSIETQCSGRQCRITESAGQLAASWSQNDRQFTIVGATDVNEVSQWVESMKL